MKDELKKEYMAEVQASFQDSLTGLYNHGFFSKALDLEFKRFKRYGTCFTVALLDVDALSQVNHRQGWIAGDKILKGVGACLVNNTRDADVAARYSEDCFAIMMPETGESSGEIPVERMLEEASSGQWPDERELDRLASRRESLERCRERALALG